jgi:hypothetical protein
MGLNPLPLSHFCSTRKKVTKKYINKFLMFSKKRYVPSLQTKSWIWLEKFDFQTKNQTVDNENQCQKCLIYKQFNKNRSFW